VIYIIVIIYIIMLKRKEECNTYLTHITVAERIQ
jgi:hypothetical protein